ncbi:MAG: VanZ family protein [Bdellovibrionota bacterium]
MSVFRVRYSLPLILWMLILWVASGAGFSASHTSSWVEMVWGWFGGSLESDGLQNLNLVLRKCGHVTAYAILSGMFLVSAGKSWNVKKNWRLPLGILAIVFSFVYASIDEWHQSWVMERTSSIADVALDTFGAVLFQLWVALRRKYDEKRQTHIL